MRADVDREKVARRVELLSARSAYNAAAAEVQRIAVEVIDPLFEEIIAAAQRRHEPTVIPESNAPGDVDEPLFDSTDEWLDQTERLMAEKI